MAQTRISQAVLEVPELGSPQNRLAQILLEVPEIGSPKTRVAQLAIEVVYDTRVASIANMYYALTPTMN